MKKCFLLVVVLGIAILLIKNWQVDSADQICQTVYLNNNWIYFTNASDGQALYKICTDGSGLI